MTTEYTGIASNSKAIDGRTLWKPTRLTSLGISELTRHTKISSSQKRFNTLDNDLEGKGSHRWTSHGLTPPQLGAPTNLRCLDGQALVLWHLYLNLAPLWAGARWSVVPLLLLSSCHSYYPPNSVRTFWPTAVSGGAGSAAHGIGRGGPFWPPLKHHPRTLLTTSKAFFQGPRTLPTSETLSKEQGAWVPTYKTYSKDQGPCPPLKHHPRTLSDRLWGPLKGQGSCLQTKWPSCGK